MPVVAAFIAALAGALVNVAVTMAGRVLIALGFGVTTYLGVSATLAWLKGNVISSLTGLPQELVSLLAYMKVGTALSIVFSAFVVSLTMQGLSVGGAISRLHIKAQSWGG
jgi:hypothetical protein